MAGLMMRHHSRRLAMEWDVVTISLWTDSLMDTSLKRESVWKQRNLGIEGDVVSCLYEFFSLAPQAPAALLPREEERQLVATSRFHDRFL